MKTIKIILCTFAAVWVPLRLLSSFLGLQSLAGFIATYGEIPGYIALVGILLLLADLWQSNKTQDQKLWWTVVGMIGAPIAIPAYWFGFGLKNIRRTTIVDVILAEQPADGKAPEAPQLPH